MGKVVTHLFFYFLSSWEWVIFGFFNCTKKAVLKVFTLLGKEYGCFHQPEVMIYIHVSSLINLLKKNSAYLIRLPEGNLLAPVAKLLDLPREQSWQFYEFCLVCHKNFWKVSGILGRPGVLRFLWGLQRVGQGRI